MTYLYEKTDFMAMPLKMGEGGNRVLGFRRLKMLYLGHLGQYIVEVLKEMLVFLKKND